MSEPHITDQWKELFQPSRNTGEARYPRSYKHFDKPLGYDKATKLVTSPKAVATHSFFPFLFYENEVRRYRGKGANAQPKKRPLMYASHRDGCIFAYYTILLTEPYEAKVKDLDISEHIIAYRKGMGNNITFADAAFEEIKRRKKCAAIALDISSFFDHIDHANLKDEWCKILNVRKLPQDHFAVFNAVTSWAKVNRDDCYKVLGIDARTAKHPICLPQDYRGKVRGGGLVQRNPNTYGIPQGSPISAFLANLYMLPFDCAMSKLAKKIGGYYRRYSDDILWICDEDKVHDVLKAVDTGLTERGAKLTRSTEKTEISIFSADTTGKISCYSLDKSGEKIPQKPFQYLGFTFDGKKKLVRSSTLSKFHRRLKYAVRGAKRAARKADNDKVYRKKLNDKFTHLGKRNFITTYMKNALKEMGDNSLSKQVSGSYERVSKELTKGQKRP